MIGFQIWHNCSMNNRNFLCQKCSKVNKNTPKSDISFFSFCLVSKTEHAALPCIHGASPAHGLGTHFPETSYSAQSSFPFCSYSPCYLCMHGKNVGAPRWAKPQCKVPRDPEKLLPLPKGLPRLRLCSLSLFFSFPLPPGQADLTHVGDRGAERHP